MRWLPHERKAGGRRSGRAGVPEDARDDPAGSRDPRRRLILSNRFSARFPDHSLFESVTLHVDDILQLFAGEKSLEIVEELIEDVVDVPVERDRTVRRDVDVRNVP